MSKRDKSLQALELPLSATLDDVEKAYYELVKVWHPDRFQSDESLRKKAEERTKEINVSYQYLIHNWSDSYSHYSNSKSQREKEKEASKEPEQEEVKQEARKVPPRSGLKDGALRKVYEMVFGFLLLTGVLLYAFYSSNLMNFFNKASSQNGLAKEEYLPIKEELKRSAERKQLSNENKLKASFVTKGLPGESFSPVPGASVSFGSRKTAPAIIKAAIACNAKSIKRQLNKNPAEIKTVDKNGNTALSWAAKQGCSSVAKILIEKNADINHASSNGFSPLIWANLHKRKEVAKLLTSAGAKQPPSYWQKNRLKE